MLTITWRNAIRHKQFTLLNLLGLSIGITASLLIGLFVMNELTYDNFHAKGDRIYRINQPMIWGDWAEQFASTGPNLAIALRADVPEFEEVTRLHSPGQHVVTYQVDGGNQASFREDKVFVAEENFFDIFSYPIVKGNSQTALLNPLSVVITEGIAKKYFGDEEPIGKTLNIQQSAVERRSFIVTAVTSNPPRNSHIQYDMLVSMSSYPNIKKREHQWIWTTFGTYGLVRQGTDIAKLETKIQQIPPKWAEVETQRVFGKSFDDYVQGKKWTLYMEPIEEAYINSSFTDNRFGPSGNYVYVQIFGAVGILILLLSSINFMNLSTARSANRAKEVGIRKTLGSSKRSLVQQFIFESVIFVLVSTIFAMVITEVSLSAFNSLANTELSLYSQLTNPLFSIVIIGFILLLGIAAGSYPAFYLSSFRPTEVLKGKLGSGFKGKKIRNGLVVFQFTMTIALIISALFVQKQLNYASKADLGFDKNNILQIHNMEWLSDQNKETFQTVLRSNPAFEKIGLSDYVPPEIWGEDKYKAFNVEMNPITLNRLRSTEDYMNLLDLELIAGRTFDKTRGAEKYKIILNETAVKDLGWGSSDQFDKDSPIGKHVTFPNSEEALFEVIGVVKNFNFNSVRYEIGPLMIIHEENEKMWESGSDFISIRFNKNLIKDSNDLSEAIKVVENNLKEVNSNVPFEYSFMDKDFEAYFRSEQQMGSVLNVFTIMAMSIACLGLFGLAAFSAEQRKKELGVRKVLGAPMYRLVIMFTSEFTILIVIAFLIASPIAYYFVQEWLADFAYKTGIDLWTFMIVAAASLSIAWFTIGFQSIKAARQNPVDVLRDE
jgi:putative ABC transport system permease protein